MMETPADKRLARAKKAALTLIKDQNRKWLCIEAKSYDCYTYLTRLHILEGTPPRAYILENAERGICTVIDMDGQVYGEARYGDYEPVRWVPKRRKS